MYGFYTNYPDNLFYQICAIVVRATNEPVETVVVSKDMADSEDFKKKKGTGKFPMLELNNGDVLFESAAIAEYLARQSASHKHALTGHSVMESAQIEQWILIASTFIMPSTIKIAYTQFGHNFDMAAYEAGVKGIKEQCKMMDKHLSDGKMFLHGGRFTLADIMCFQALSVPFQFCLDAGFQKAMPWVSAWFKRCA